MGSSDAGAHFQMLCAAGDTTLLLARHVRDRGDLTVEAAVREVTGKQSDLFGFRDRGYVRPGFVADLTVFALEDSTGTTTSSSPISPEGLAVSAVPKVGSATRSRTARSHNARVGSPTRVPRVSSIPRSADRGHPSTRSSLTAYRVPSRIRKVRTMSERVATLVSVNVGLPREITWQGQTVFTGIWKEAVEGPRTVRRLNVDGDGQGDLKGHGGEQRAVYVYQLDSYRYWQDQMQRDDFTFGQFGENFTVEGLGDDEVCIGDRYRIGSALFEVTQPRVTCYRVGIRMDEPRMAALLVAHGRPGFYFRVLEEGDVRAGDDVMKIATGPEAMTVADVNALLYLAGRHDVEQLRRALRIPALSPGWQASLQALLDEELGGSPGGGNAGLTAQGPPPAWRGFRTLRVAAKRSESSDVVSLELESDDGQPLARARPGQFITLKLRPGQGSSPLVRSYSLSGSPGDANYRIGVKVEPHGAAGHYIRTDVRVGDRLEVGAPRGLFILDDSERPVVLASAGVGVTPMLAMLHALHDRRSTRDIWWFHGARNRSEHAFAEETQVALGRPCPRAPSHLVQPARPDGPRGHGLRRGRAHHPGGTRSGRRPDRRRVLPVRTDRVHGRAARGSRRARGCRRTRAHRDLRCRGIDHARSRRSVRCGRRINPKAHRARDRSSRSCGPGSTCVGAKGTRASSSWPRPATCRCDGRVAPASATPARPVSSTERSTTPPSHSRRPPTATCSCAARAPTPISRSTCDRPARSRPSSRRLPPRLTAREGRHRLHRRVAVIPARACGPHAGRR